MSAEPSSSTGPLGPSPRTTDSSTQTSQSALAQGQVTLRRGGRSGAARRPRPASMVDYQSYRHTQQLVRKILEQPAAQGLAPEVQELVESIRNVLESDQEHMEEAVRCASYIEQVGVWSNPTLGLQRAIVLGMEYSIHYYSILVESPDQKDTAPTVTFVLHLFITLFTSSAPLKCTGNIFAPLKMLKLSNLIRR